MSKHINSKQSSTKLTDNQIKSMLMWAKLLGKQGVTVHITKAAQS